MALSLWQSRNEGKAVQNAIKGQLDVALSQLEKLQRDGRFPSVQGVQDALKDEAVMRQFNTTSIFGYRDLLYNASEPPVGGQALILCARVPDYALFGIYADRKVRIIGEAELRQAHLVSFSDMPTQIQSKPPTQNSN